MKTIEKTAIHLVVFSCFKNDWKVHTERAHFRSIEIESEH